MKKCASWCNKIILFLDKAPLWIVGIGLYLIVFSLFFYMGEQTVFEIHDQLDETIMFYLLPARHLFERGADIFPEMLGGIQASAVQPADMLALPLYRYLPTITAFLIQYSYVFLLGFFGMYFCVRELTKSSILALGMGGLFCMIPSAPVHGLSVYGIPLIFYAYICLYKKKNIIISLVLVAVFGFTSHLVYTGYVVLGFCLLAVFILLLRKEECKWLSIGFLELLCINLFTNRGLITELLFHNASYISHREESIKYGMPFWDGVKECFVNSAQHGYSYHKYLIVPIILLLAAGCFRRKNKEIRVVHNMALMGFGLLILIALFYGLCNSQIAADFRNNISGFLRYFQIECFYWIYPAGWYIEFALAFAVLWMDNGLENAEKPTWIPTLSLIVMVVILIPTMGLIMSNSNYYRHLYQMKYGTNRTGHITWEKYYAEDLMEELEQAIGKDMSTYRVAHLGISPTPALVHGFYTVDGYSNNYSLDYKHRFREVIAEEIEQIEETRIYFDDWGNRCYLFNSFIGTYYRMPKNSGVTFQGLQFDMDSLKELDCEYIFSGAEILDAERMGLDFLGYYETENSYWGIWLYELN